MLRYLVQNQLAAIPKIPCNPPVAMVKRFACLTLRRRIVRRRAPEMQDPKTIEFQKKPLTLNPRPTRTICENAVRLLLQMVTHTRKKKTSQILMSRKASKKWSQRNALLLMTLWLALTRSTARIFCSGDKNLAFAWVSGRNQSINAAQIAVRMAKAMKSHYIRVSRILHRDVV